MADKKRLLIYAHYYVPDTASTGQLLHELAEGLSDTFRVTVICVVPSYEGVIEEKYKKHRFYREELNGVRLLRIRVPEFRKSDKKSRVMNILSYFTGAALATFYTGGQDYIFALSQPPILGGLLGVWGKWIKRAKYIYNIQDFNPEQVMSVGYSRSRFLLGIMMGFDKFSCRRSDLVITVGRDLVQTLEERFKGKREPKHALINNWIDEKEICPLPEDDPGVQAFRETYALEGRFVIMYSGNIGLYYDLENLLRVIGRFPPGTKASDGREVVFAFVGAGSVLEKMVRYTQEQAMENVVYIPYQDKKNLAFSLNAGDVHWCVNAKGIRGVSCPSKYYGIAACAKPVLGVLEPGSEIRLLIEQTEGGLCAQPGDYQKIEENIRWFIGHAGKEALIRMGQRGRENLLRNMTKAISLEKYKKAILES